MKTLVRHLVLGTCFTVLMSGFLSLPKKEIVIYTSVDSIYAEPILNAFEQKTGIKVKPASGTKTGTISEVEEFFQKI